MSTSEVSDKIDEIIAHVIENEVEDVSPSDLIELFCKKIFVVATFSEDPREALNEAIEFMQDIEESNDLENAQRMLDDWISI